jgi:hypothetical protein
LAGPNRREHGNHWQEPRCGVSRGCPHRYSVD